MGWQTDRQTDMCIIIQFCSILICHQGLGLLRTKVRSDLSFSRWFSQKKLKLFLSRDRWMEGFLVKRCLSVPLARPNVGDNIETFCPDMTKCSSARNSRITLFHSNKHFIFTIVDPIPRCHSYLN